MNVNVPGDVSLVHLSLSEEAKNWAGIDVGAKGLGSAAVNLLADHFTRNDYGIPETPKSQLLTGRWKEGKTLRNSTLC